jgi:hypothetical protein
MKKPERLDDTVVQALREAGISFQEVTPPLNLPYFEDVPIGERI